MFGISIHFDCVVIGSINFVNGLELK
jgi:hypothetical protein